MGRTGFLAAIIGLGLVLPAPDVLAQASGDAKVTLDAALPATRPKPRPAAKDQPKAEIAPEAAAEPAAPPPAPAKGAVTSLPIPRYVSLKGSEGNARRGPGLTHRIDWVFTRSGMPLRVTAEHENWRRVEDAEGLGGWVHYSLLSGVRSVLVAEDMASFLARPDDRANLVFQAELGVIGRLMECQPDWCRVNVEGEKGWVRKAALWGVDPGEVVE